MFWVTFVVIKKMSQYKWMVVEWCALHAVKREEHIRIESNWCNSKSECLKDYREKMKGDYDIVDCWVSEEFLVKRKLLK